MAENACGHPGGGWGRRDEQVEHEDFSVHERIPCRVAAVAEGHPSRHVDSAAPRSHGEPWALVSQCTRHDLTDTPCWGR